MGSIDNKDILDKFDFISPLDFRYVSSEELREISKYLSENARICYQAKVEAAIVKVLSDFDICSKKIYEEVKKAAEEVKAKEVYEEEKRIKHDIRALVNVLRSKVSDEAKPYIHFSATSYDIVDTANSLRYKDSISNLVLPELLKLEKTLIDLSIRYKDQLQIGRTHGQHAEPITFGFALAVYVARLGNRIENLKLVSDSLYGKFSGAVGAYNAQSLLIKNPLDFEEKLMSELGLKVTPASTQIVMPEVYEDLQHSLISTFTVLANLSDDMRHLQRSEINEVAEMFESSQVGSSTMPHKRNPINFENVKSLWKAFMPRVITSYLDGISEHQRDLTNSASQRFMVETIVVVYLSARRLNKVLSKLVVDEKAMLKNFESAKNKIVAEPLYILLAKYGHKDAHEEVRKITLEADSLNKSVFEIMKSKPELNTFLNKMNKQELLIIEKPEYYIGLSSKKAEVICNEWRKRLNI